MISQVDSLQRRLGLAALGSAIWLGWVALVPQTQGLVRGGDTTWFGTEPVLHDSDSAFWLHLVAIGVVAAVVGLTKFANPTDVGFWLVAPQVALALVNAPRGDGDGLWIFVVPVLVAVGFGAAEVTNITRRIRDRRDLLDDDVFSARTAAFFIDLLLIGGVLFVPLDALSAKGSEEIAIVGGVIVASLALAIPLMAWGGSVGQLLVGLRVEDRSAQPVTPTRATVRSFLLVAELVASAPLLWLPLLFDFVVANAGNQTLVDRLAGTRVVACRADAAIRP